MKEISRVLKIGMRKIDRVKKRFIEEGLGITLNGKKGVEYTPRRPIEILKHISLP